MTRAESGLPVQADPSPSFLGVNRQSDQSAVHGDDVPILSRLGLADMIEMKKGNIVASAVVLIWGAAILVFAATGGAATSPGGSSYNAGRTAGLVFGLVMLVAGARGLFKALSKHRA